MTPKLTKPYLLLDAGGTLDYPNASLIADAAQDLGFMLTSEEFLEAFFYTLFEVDKGLRDGKPVDWHGRFLEVAVEKAGVTGTRAAGVVEEAKRRSGDRNLWTYTMPWVEPALRKLHTAGYRMSIISNADGTVDQQMRDLELIQYIDQVFDSARVGFGKPDPQIFQAALSELGLEATSAIYVGDVVMVDVFGANRVGIAGIHIDNAKLYSGWPGIHVKSIAALADSLLSGEIQLGDERLFPFRSK